MSMRSNHFWFGFLFPTHTTGRGWRHART